jgi:acetate kinase
MKILIANPGTTSYKCRLYDMESGRILYKAGIERIGEAESSFIWQHSDSEETQEKLSHAGYAEAVEAALQKMVIRAPLGNVSAVGFKTVHAKGISGCVLLDDKVLRAMEEYLSLAQVHTMAYLDAIRIFKKLSGSIPLVGLFETSFHTEIPPEAYLYGIPFEYHEKHGIRKYGFHGASHRWISERIKSSNASGIDRPRIISCHLGGSSSVCAIDGGISVDTSMGMSPQCGLLNAKRVGDMDPFALLFLMEKENLSIDETREILYSKGGLAGISGLSGDMRDIIDEMNRGNSRARTAFQAFAYSVKRYIGEYFAVLNGADFLVFTGGIGERSPLVREEIAGRLDNLGIVLDRSRNSSIEGEGIISTDDSSVKIAVIAANEEFVVARAVMQFISEMRS